MSIYRFDCRIYKEETGTPGGVTYHIILKGDKNPRALCFRPIHGNREWRCEKVAGYGTSHVGTGACKFHGGADKTPVITNGRTAFATKQRLAEKIDAYLNKSRDELLDLTKELAAIRAIFDEALEHFPDPDAEDYGMWFRRMTELIGTIGSLVEKISRTDSRNTLTAAQVLYLRATVADILMKYIKDPADRERAAKELATRMGGDVEVEMRPSEFSLPDGM